MNAQSCDLNHSPRAPRWQNLTLSMLAGLGCGWLAAPSGMALLESTLLAQITPWVMLPATFFLALVGLVVMPLVFSSILLAITGSSDSSFAPRAAVTVVVYFVISTIVAVLIGMGLSALIDPAHYVHADWAAGVAQGHSVESAVAALSHKDTLNLPSLISGIIPANPVAIFVEQNMLHIVIAAALAGVAITGLAGRQRAVLIDFADGVQAACMCVVGWAMWLAPAAVFGFLFRLASDLGSDALRTLGAYVGTVLLGLLCILAAYLLLVMLVARRHPLRFLRDIRETLLMAFSSSSSAATMPLSLATAQDKLGVRPQIARLVIPLGTTINMDGTAIYQIIVALFLINLLGIELTTAQTILLGATVVGAAIGSPGTPGVGIVILSGVLFKLGVPPEGIGLILSVDRLLDMCRTAINVCGDLTASVVMNRLLPV